MQLAARPLVVPILTLALAGLAFRSASGDGDPASEARSVRLDVAGRASVLLDGQEVAEVELPGTLRLPAGARLAVRLDETGGLAQLVEQEPDLPVRALELWEPSEAELRDDLPRVSGLEELAVAGGGRRLRSATPYPTLRLPPEAAAATTLRALRVQDCFLADSAFFSRLTTLEEITLQNVRGLDDAALGRLGELPRLRRVELRWCSSAGARGLVRLARAPALEALHLGEGGADVSTGAFEALAAAPRLRALLLDEPDLTDELALALAGSESLSHVEATAAHPEFSRSSPRGALTDAGFGALCRLPGLRRLELDFRSLVDTGGSPFPPPTPEEPPATGISPEGWSALEDAASLETLALEDAHDLTRLPELPALRELSLSGRDVATIPWGELPRLRRVELSGCRTLDDAGLAGLAELPRLRTLTVANCGQVTGRFLAHVPPGLRMLEVRVDALTDAAIARLPRLPRLTWLELFGCDALTAEAIASVADRAPRLRGVRLPDGIGDPGLAAFVGHSALRAVVAPGAEQTARAVFSCIRPDVLVAAGVTQGYLELRARERVRHD